MEVLTHLSIDSDDDWTFFVQGLPHDQVKIVAIHRLGLSVSAVAYTRDSALAKVRTRIERIIAHSQNKQPA